MRCGALESKSRFYVVLYPHIGLIFWSGWTQYPRNTQKASERTFSRLSLDGACLPI
jgi:hypothetical protein